MLGTLYGVLTTLAYAAFLLVLRADQPRPPPPGRARCSTRPPLGGGVSAVGGRAARRGRPRAELARRTAGCVLLALTSQVIGWLLISVSLPRLPAALTSVLLLVQPVGAVVARAC